MVQTLIFIWYNKEQEQAMRIVNGYVIEPNADLANVNLTLADLPGADLTDANLCGAILTGTNLTNTYRAG